MWTQGGFRVNDGVVDADNSRWRCEVHTTTQEESERTRLPTIPSSVVWSGGHSYVLEARWEPGSARWVGLDDRGRPLALTPKALQRRGWSHTPS